MVIVTGGLGPTVMTSPANVLRSCCSFEEHAETRERIIAHFQKRKAHAEVVLAQAQIPHGATVLPNDHGTAPAALQTGRGWLIPLPCPPRELRPMWLKWRRCSPVPLENPVLTRGENHDRESSVEDVLRPFRRRSVLRGWRQVIAHAWARWMCACPRTAAARPPC